jgi:cyclic-di-GMP phosphodiesterase TipF (flagellum assembly factor)
MPGKDAANVNFEPVGENDAALNAGEAGEGAEEFAPEPGAVLKGRSESEVRRLREEIESESARSSSRIASEAASSTAMGDAASPDDPMLANVSRAIEEKRMDIYLQPVVRLPGRQTRYYEVFTRLRCANGSLITPDLFTPAAEKAGLMPLIDNMMLVRAIRIIRSMDKYTSAQGLFCSLSTQSLIDPDFFPKLVGFLEKNNDLAGRIIFEISQAQKKAAGHLERENMRQLGRLGFSFSLDKVIDLDIDYNDLARNHYKYVRISADRLINGMAELGARIHGADKADYLERFGLRLIVERIETERQLVTLSDYNIKLGQGYLFAEPRPVRPEILGVKAA